MLARRGPRRPDAPLIGREADVAAVRRLALGRDRTFITLAGIGGVGKSRLAVEVTRRAMPRRDGRVAFVSLDGVSDPSLVLPAIAGAMGVPEEPGRPLRRDPRRGPGPQAERPRPRHRGARAGSARRRSPTSSPARPV